MTKHSQIRIITRIYKTVKLWISEFVSKLEKYTKKKDYRIAFLGLLLFVDLCYCHILMTSIFLEHQEIRKYQSLIKKKVLPIDLRTSIELLKNIEQKIEHKIKKSCSVFTKKTLCFYLCC